MDPVDDTGPPPSQSGGIMVFYPCAPDELISDPRTNQLIKRAITQAGANLARDSPMRPSGFALMVPNSNFEADQSCTWDPLETLSLVDKASGGDGPWVASESKQTQWSPREDYGFKYVDRSTEMSPENFLTSQTEDRATSTTPPQLCHKFTSCSPTPSTTSTYPDSGVEDAKSASCQDLVDSATAPRDKRLSSGDTIASSEDDFGSASDERRAAEDEEDDPFDVVNQILGASLIRPIPGFPFVETRDQTTTTEEVEYGIDDKEGRLLRDDFSMIVRTGSQTSLDEDFHSPVDSDDKDEEFESSRFEETFTWRDAKTDTEDLSWMISIAVGTPDKDSEDYAVESTDQQRITASPPLPFKKGSGFLRPTYVTNDAQVQTASSLFAASRSSQVSPERVLSTTVASTNENAAGGLTTESSIQFEVRDVLTDIVDSVVRRCSLNITRSEIDTYDYPPVKRSNKKCQAAAAKADCSTMTQIIPPIKKCNKKLMTEQWVANPCDAFSSVSPRDLTLLELSPVVYEEYLPQSAEIGVQCGDVGRYAPLSDETFHSFLTANESTVPDKDVDEMDGDVAGVADAGSIAGDAESFVKEMEDKGVSATVETKDGFTHMKKQKFRCAATNTEGDDPVNLRPRERELEERLKDVEAALAVKNEYITQLEVRLASDAEAIEAGRMTVSRLEQSLIDSLKENRELESSMSVQNACIQDLEERLERSEMEWKCRCQQIEEEKISLDQSLRCLAVANHELTEMHDEMLRMRGETEDVVDNRNNDNLTGQPLGGVPREENNDGSMLIAYGLVDEIVDLAVDKHDLSRWTAEKIIADLVSTALIKEPAELVKASKPETAEASVGTVRIKTKAKKTNTEIMEYANVGCDAIGAGVLSVERACDPIDQSVSTVEIACDPIEPETSDVGIQSTVDKVEKFTHMDVPKIKSVSVATHELEFVEASTSTTGDVIDNATQVEVVTKDKGTSCKVKKSKSKETMTCDIETIERWTSMSSLTQVKDKAVSASLNTPSRSVATSVSSEDISTFVEISTMTEVPTVEEGSQVDPELSLLLAVESFTQYDAADAAPDMSTIFTVGVGTQVDSVETAEKATVTKKNKVKSTATETEKAPESKDAVISAVCQYRDAEVDATREVLDVAVDATRESIDAEVNAVCQSVDKDSSTTDLRLPVVDGVVCGVEMKTDLKEYAELCLDVGIQTEEAASRPVDVAVNTDSAELFDEAVQAIASLTDQPVGAEEGVVGGIDVATSMGERKKYRDAETQVKSTKLKVKQTMTEGPGVTYGETTMESRVDYRDGFTCMGSSADVEDRQTSTEEWEEAPKALEEAPEEQICESESTPCRALASFSPDEALSSTRVEDGADNLGLEDGSFHTCHQHSPTLLTGEDEHAPPPHLQTEDRQDRVLQRRTEHFLFSPSPIAGSGLVDFQDVATDTADLDEHLAAMGGSSGPTPSAVSDDDERGAPKAASSIASPLKTSELVKRLMAPTVASSSKRRSPKLKRKGTKGMRGVDSPLIVKGIKSTDRPSSCRTGSPSSPEDGSPEVHQGFQSVMKELKKRMSDIQLPAQDNEVEEGFAVDDPHQQQISSELAEAPCRRFRLPGVSSAIASSTPSKIPTPKSVVHSIARRRRSPEFDLGQAATAHFTIRIRREEDRVRKPNALGVSSGAPPRRHNIGVVRPSRSMETVHEDTILPQTLGNERLSRTLPSPPGSKSKLLEQIENEISRRESRLRSSDVTKLDLRYLRDEISPATVGAVGKKATAAAAPAVASPTGSDDDRRLSSRSRESKDLEWENEWELAQQPNRQSRLVATASLDALTADLGFSVHSFDDSNAELDVSRIEFLENKIENLEVAISRRDSTLREYRTELEERDLHVDHCNQVLQETQTHYAKLAQENSSLKGEVDKLERVMLMQDEQIMTLNMDKNRLQHDIEYKDSEHQEVYKFLEDEKRILEEDKKSLEQDKMDLESALRTAQEELRMISENMAVERDDFDKQRLINVLEGAESELDNLGEQVVAEQVLKDQLATENKTLKDLLDQARRHSLESIGKIESMERVLRDRKECRLSQERVVQFDQPAVERDARVTAPSTTIGQEESVHKILSEILSVAAELMAELLKTPSSCPNSPIYPSASKGTSSGRKSVPHADAEGDCGRPSKSIFFRASRQSLLQDLSTLHDNLYEFKSLLLIYKKEAQDAIGDLVSSNIQLIDEQYAQGNTVAKRLEMEKAQEIEDLRKELKDSQKHVKLGKSQIETYLRSMKKQNERIKDLEDQNRAFELQIALSRDEGRRESHAFVSFPREDSTMEDSSFQESRRLKKEYWRLISKQISDKEHYDRLFGKLTRRMQVLEDNWRKADDEVVLLDGLVQHIRIALMDHLATIKGCDSLFALLQELNAVVEAAGGDVNSNQRTEIGAASSPADTISTPTTSQSS